MKTADLEEGKNILYKSFELQPLHKFAVQVGEKASKQVMERLQYLANLTIPRNLAWVGLDKDVTPLDKETAEYIRDHAIFSSVRKIADEGVAHQYGKVLLEGQSGPNSLVGTGSAIALIQETEDGSLRITRKNKIGLDNKQAKELIGDFHNFKETRSDPLIPGREEDEEYEKMDGEEAFMHEQLQQKRNLPSLKKEQLPPLKKGMGGKAAGKEKLPWKR
jgi:hypothetical protein